LNALCQQKPVLLLPGNKKGGTDQIHATFLSLLAI